MNPKSLETILARLFLGPKNRKKNRERKERKKKGKKSEKKCYRVEGTEIEAEVERRKSGERNIKNRTEQKKRQTFVGRREKRTTFAVRYAPYPAAHRKKQLMRQKNTGRKKYAALNDQNVSPALKSLP